MPGSIPIWRSAVMGAARADVFVMPWDVVLEDGILEGSARYDGREGKYLPVSGDHVLRKGRAACI